jgi:hypothetical protein
MNSIIEAQQEYLEQIPEYLWKVQDLPVSSQYIFARVMLDEKLQRDAGSIGAVLYRMVSILDKKNSAGHP